MRRAKIVATLGPATESYEMIRAIIDAGVDVARLNLSHGSYAEHEGRFANVRKAADEIQVLALDARCSRGRTFIVGIMGRHTGHLAVEASRTAGVGLRPTM